MPASRATLPHFASSLEMKRLNSSGGMRTGSAPSVSMRRLVSFDCSTSETAA